MLFFSDLKIFFHFYKSNLPICFFDNPKLIITKKFFFLLYKKILNIQIFLYYILLIDKLLGPFSAFIDKVLILDITSSIVYVTFE